MNRRLFIALVSVYMWLNVMINTRTGTIKQARESEAERRQRDKTERKEEDRDDVILLSSEREQSTVKVNDV